MLDRLWEWANRVTLRSGTIAPAASGRRDLSTGALVVMDSRKDVRAASAGSILVSRLMNLAACSKSVLGNRRRL
jgi:hypothetical protein